MSLRARHAYFDEDGNIHTFSQARYERVMDAHTHEAIPELAGRRVRVLSLYVRFEGRVPIEIVNIDASLVAFDDEGRRDQTEAERERRAAVGLLGGPSRSPDPSNVVSAATRFESAGFHWRPTREQIEAVIAAHRLQHE